MIVLFKFLKFLRMYAKVKSKKILSFLCPITLNAITLLFILELKIVIRIEHEESISDIIREELSMYRTRELRIVNHRYRGTADRNLAVIAS